MRHRSIVAGLALLALVSLSAACGSVTRGAIRNDTAQPVTVMLQSPDGKKEVRFEKVPPQSTSAFEKLPFKSALADIVVQILEGQAKGGNVDLVKVNDNVVVVSPDAPPTVDSKENPDNKFW
ncbi:MAG: hypothetical protein H6744_12615 [Deltaproteobacteria bacterium]|nr:hypothetical protein [Deltaproteobacteria bacterium]MCB9787515.1 hypothetical protein [Deltaproteobacteria bacterium]